MNELMQFQEKLRSRVLSIEEISSLKEKGCEGIRRSGGGKRRRRVSGCSSVAGKAAIVDTRSEVKVDIAEEEITPVLGVGID